MFHRALTSHSTYRPFRFSTVTLRITDNACALHHLKSRNCINLIVADYVFDVSLSIPPRG